MRSIDKILRAIEEKRSRLCVGLDTDISKLPGSLNKNIGSILEFNRAIIDATSDMVCSYKLNFAFYEQYGVEGIDILKKTFDYIPKDIFSIADAKRGDIGNTSRAYASSCFEYFGADSVTVSPYMGSDSVGPFLEHQNKFVFLLALTSNTGSGDFQRLVHDNKPVYRHVIETSSTWAGKDNLGYVVGATHPSELQEIRKLIPGNVLLIPGIGAQGGDIKATMEANGNGPAIINVSRSIIYASRNDDYIEKTSEKALYFRDALNL